MTVSRIGALVALTCLASLTLVAPAAGQDEEGVSEPEARDALYFELGGNALIYSFNYERRLSDRTTARGGLMFLALNATNEGTGESASVNVALLPLMMNWLMGEGSGRLELGIGPLFGLAGGNATDVEGTNIDFSGAGLSGVTSTIGYRYHPPDGGLIFRGGLVPFYSGGPQIWAGLSLGYAF